MSLKVAFQMDPIQGVDIDADSTFRIAEEAQARGHELFFYTPDRLMFREGRVMARGWPMELRRIRGDHVTLGDEALVDLSDFDVVWLRQDPPFDMGYITTTHILDMVHPETMVVNDPFWVRNYPEKLLVLQFPDLTPPTMIARSYRELKDFKDEHGDIILKPLYGNGGASVFRIRPEDTNLGSLVELFQTVFREPFMVQAYLPAVRSGDKRIILVDGEVAGAINRVPAEGETRSNLHVGGTAAPTELTGREREICARLGPELKRRGLLFTGIDVIGGYLTEINVTSPTGIRQVKDFGGADIATLIWDAIEARIARRKGA